MLAAVVVACLLAPLYASRVSGTDPFRSNVNGTAFGQEVLAENTAGLGLGVTPIGPTWRGAYMLGADTLGRDVAARLMDNPAPPPPLYVGDPDTQVRWYLRLKREYAAARAEGRAFVNPLRAQTLRWRS